MVAWFGMVTTLPAKARSFCPLQRPWLQQKLLRLRMRHPATLAPEGSIRAQCLGLCTETVFLPNGGGCESNSPGEHLIGHKRDTLYPPASPVEPRERIVLVKVLLQAATNVIACQGRRQSAYRRTQPKGDPHSPPA